MVLIFILCSACLLIGYLVGVKDEKLQSIYQLTKKYSFLFRIIVSFIFTALLILSAYYIQSKVGYQKFDTAEKGKYLLNGLLGIGIVYTILTFEFTVKKSKEEERSQKSLTTFTAISRWHEPPLIDYSKVIAKFENGVFLRFLKEDVNEAIRIVDNPGNENLRTAIGGIFNYFEVICAAVNEGIMDCEFVERFFSSVFEDYYDNWMGYIKARRERWDDSTLWMDFTNFVENYRNRKSLK